MILELKFMMLEEKSLTFWFYEREKKLLKLWGYNLSKNVKIWG